MFFIIGGAIGALIEKKRYGESSEPEEGMLAGVAIGLIIDFVAAGTGIAIWSVHEDNTWGKVLNGIKDQVVLKENQMNDLLSYNSGIDNFRSASVTCYKDTDGQYKLKFFGNDSNSELKNVEYTVQYDDFSKYASCLKQVLQHDNNRKVSGEIVSTSFRSHKGTEFVADRDSFYDYRDKIINLYNSLENCVKYSTICNVTDVGHSESFKSIVANEYNLDTNRSSLVGDYRGFMHQNINSNYVYADNFLVDISNVYKVDSGYIVKCSCLQNDNSLEYKWTDGEDYHISQTSPEQVNWYCINGAFKVNGENLSDEQVYQKISAGEYTFTKGEKQTQKAQEITDNKLELLY